MSMLDSGLGSERDVKRAKIPWMYGLSTDSE